MNGLARAGQPALAGENAGDLMIGVVGGQATDQLERVRVGSGVTAGLGQCQLVVGDGSALPHDAHQGALLFALNGDDDVGDHRPQ